MSTAGAFFVLVVWLSEMPCVCVPLWCDNVLADQSGSDGVLHGPTRASAFTIPYLPVHQLLLYHTYPCISFYYSFPGKLQAFNLHTRH